MFQGKVLIYEMKYLHIVDLWSKVYIVMTCICKRLEESTYDSVEDINESFIIKLNWNHHADHTRNVVTKLLHEPLFHITYRTRIISLVI